MRFGKLPHDSDQFENPSQDVFLPRIQGNVDRDGCIRLMV